eukprot:TRINITY_DN6299_c0_g1_i3.p1 TRINITY_DN6299_c0_g1~~TRINITY_DN6299_c0_g1_i3.p1  ORF type:complete len:223 (+),score=-12.49 TRINITY_DN6299_c0_g1_i3:16-684(+)
MQVRRLECRHVLYRFFFFFFLLTLRCGLVCPLNLYAFTPKVWPLLKNKIEKAKKLSLASYCQQSYSSYNKLPVHVSRFFAFRLYPKQTPTQLNLLHCNKFFSFIYCCKNFSHENHSLATKKSINNKVYMYFCMQVNTKPTYISHKTHIDMPCVCMYICIKHTVGYIKCNKISTAKQHSGDGMPCVFVHLCYLCVYYIYIFEFQVIIYIPNHVTHNKTFFLEG